MHSKSVLLLLMLLLAKASSLYAGEAQSSWSLIIRYESGNETYYDATPRTYKEFIVLRFMRNLAAGGSFVTDVAIDCPNRAATTLRQVRYQGQMGNGQQLDAMVVDEGIWKNNPWPPWDKFALPPEVGFDRLASEACNVSRTTPTNWSAQTAFSLEAWIKQDYGFKLNLIKGFIEVAKKDNVTVRLPAEYYVREVDRLVANSIKNGDAGALKHSLGISLKTIAVMDCDWDTGNDPLPEARSFLGEAIFDLYKKNYPEKYQRLVAGCK